jgi:Tat protein translocase TatB subunit
MGFQEILIIVLVAIVVLKPSEVPGFLYKCGKLFQQLRKLIGGFQGTLNEVLSEGELDEIKTKARKRALVVEPVSISSKKRRKK